MSEQRRSTDDARPWRGLLETARHVGHYSWTEHRLFQVLGAWSVSETEPSVKIHLDAQSHRHAWHAALFFDRLPELREVDADALIVAPNGSFADVVDLLGSATTTIERLVGLHQVVVPHLVETYRAERAARTDVADASLRRWLGLVIADLEEDRLAGDVIVQTLLADAALVGPAQRQREVLGTALARSGGLQG